MNPFVNPDHRDANLPAGCKDLNVLLEKYPSWGQRTFQLGEIISIKYYLDRLISSTATHRHMMIAYPEANVLVTVSGHKGHPYLRILVTGERAGLIDVMQQIFGQEAVGPGDAGGKNPLITIPLPAPGADGAKPIFELFWRGFGLSKPSECCSSTMNRIEVRADAPRIDRRHADQRSAIKQTGTLRYSNVQGPIFPRATALA